MIAFPDTSFLFALYRLQENTGTALAYYNQLPEPLHVSDLLMFEFRQALRFAVWLRAQRNAGGVTANEAQGALSAFGRNLSDGVLARAAVDWTDVCRIADRLSSVHTHRQGHRPFDILHVATALHLGVRNFISFDLNQRRLASAEGLVPVP